MPERREDAGIAPTRVRPDWSVARSWLLLPGTPDGENIFDDAIASDVDVVVLDLEDGLPDAETARGRATVRRWLSGTGHAWVRIADTRTPAWADDLAAVATAPGLGGVILAKTESPEDVRATARRLPDGMPIVALIESALGIERASEIAGEPACARMAFGVGDFRRDTGMSADPMALAYPRSRLVVASRAAAIAAPIDGPTLRSDTRHLTRDTEIAKSMGMGGRLCLDTGHAATINNLLSPSTDEIDSARTVLATLGGSGGVYDGSSRPTMARAEDTLTLARRLGLLGDS
ncbi:HpcH/HpaI aldolase/citrate lyase family protein [Gordonia insulae]|uniref:Citrate lyase subunit beta-like protein n=1 Tax=Gordonia insulae TaxID=2420509 RepID=A0A3G8JPQ6_9ACTN|nr:aldolase/citrate lyase family protein [Gordonia insulae]AZG46502.1 Citrate lyase subunit beta-like protein [Gordonia insulae]